MRNPPSTVVVDASIAIKWNLPEPDSDRAFALLAQWRSDGTSLVAPSWFPCELTNVLFRQVLGGKMDVLQARAFLDGTLVLFQLLDLPLTLAGDALEIAHRLDQKASYDAQYLALAEYLDCELWTADERFWNAATTAFPRVRRIGEFTPTDGGMVAPNI